MNNVEKKLLRLLKLEDGWHYGEGKKITQESVLIALAFNRKVNEIEQARYIEAFPTSEGFVNLRIGLGNQNIIGLIIESEDIINLYWENKDDIRLIKQTDIKQLFVVIKEKIKQYENGNEKWATLGYCTVTTIHMKNESSSPIYSSNLESYPKESLKEESHLLVNRPQCVDISMNGKKSSRMPHQNHSSTGIYNITYPKLRIVA